MQIFVTGATGAIGQPLVAALREAGHAVIAATRRPSSYKGPAEPLAFDLDGGRAPQEPLDPTGRARCADVAYYLVHALDQRNFAVIDRQRAERFADWWGPERPVVYLGGLGADGTSSAHLRSRHEVGQILRERCATVELRASMVLGTDSVSFQLLARLGRLASMVPLGLPVPVPCASDTLTQPIAEADLIEELVEAATLEPGCYDVGGPEVLTYWQLIERSAEAQGRRVRAAPVVPLDPQWIGPVAALAAGTDPWATTALFAGMGTETVASGRQLPASDRVRTSIDDAIAIALRTS